MLEGVYINQDFRQCNGLVCLMIGTCGGLLGLGQWSFGLHKTKGVSWPHSQEGLCSLELVI